MHYNRGLRLGVTATIQAERNILGLRRLVGPSSGEFSSDSDVMHKALHGVYIKLQLDLSHCKWGSGQGTGRRSWLQPWKSYRDNSCRSSSPSDAAARKQCSSTQPWNSLSYWGKLYNLPEANQRLDKQTKGDKSWFARKHSSQVQGQNYLEDIVCYTQRKGSRTQHNPLAILHHSGIWSSSMQNRCSFWRLSGERDAVARCGALDTRFHFRLSSLCVPGTSRLPTPASRLPSFA